LKLNLRRTFFKKVLSDASLLNAMLAALLVLVGDGCRSADLSFSSVFFSSLCSVSFVDF
jgi:hypothetical protein